VREAKRYLLDSLGCAYAATCAHDVKIALSVLDEVAASVPPP